ncbi:hypothetical protein IV505_00835 [Pseudomonas fulva]|nr:hypothetical protein [Pseudomonas fulva]MBF8778275.1 hypothetical protein [Pseudomonas fulva]
MDLLAASALPPDPRRHHRLTALPMSLHAPASLWAGIVDHQDHYFMELDHGLGDRG